MTVVLTEAESMGRKKTEVGPKPIGPLFVKNLYRLGLADVVVRSGEVARIVSSKTGKSISRQRISAMMNAVRVEPETIELLARGLGVKPSELTRDDPVEIRD